MSPLLCRVSDAGQRQRRDALPDEDAAEGRERDGAQRARLQSDARHEYRRYRGVTGSDQGVSVETHCVPISSQTLPSIPRDDSEAAPDRPTGKIAQIGRVGLH